MTKTVLFSRVITQYCKIEVMVPDGAINGDACDEALKVLHSGERPRWETERDDDEWDNWRIDSSDDETEVSE